MLKIVGPDAPNTNELLKLLDIEGGYKLSNSTMVFPAEHSEATVIMTHGGAGTVCMVDDPNTRGHLYPSSIIRFLKSRNISTILVHTGTKEYTFPYIIGTILERLPWITTNQTELTAKQFKRSVLYVTKLIRDKWCTETYHDIINGLRMYTKSISDAIDVYDQPVYLLGHCNSNFFLSYAYNRLRNPKIKGIILSAILANTPLSMLPKEITDRFHSKLNFFPKNKTLDVPVLILHHEGDVSDGTCPENAIELHQQISKNTSKLVELYLASGGINEGDPKLGYGYHGFRGIEEEIANRIANFIHNQNKY